MKQTLRFAAGALLIVPVTLWIAYDVAVFYVQAALHRRRVSRGARP